jgi:hypothetical protein
VSVSVDDSFSGDIERAGNHREALDPVQPVTGEDFLAAPADMDLDAIAVEFDFMKSLPAFRRLGLQRCKLGFNEPRHGGDTLRQ